MRRGSATRLDAKHHGSVSSGTEGSTRSSSAQSKGPGVEHKRRATRSCNAPPQVWLAKGRSGGTGGSMVMRQGQGHDAPRVTRELRDQL